MKKGFYLPCLLVFCFLLNSVTGSASVPVVTSDPRDTAACSGSHVWFAVSDTGTATPTNKWQVSTDGGFSWSNLRDTMAYTGTATDTLKILTNMSLTGYKFRAIATNSNGADTSLAAGLRVDTTAGPITGSSAVCVGGSVTLGNAVSGGTWSRNHRLIDTVTAVGGLLTGIARGYDTVSYTVINTCGTSVSTLPVRVDTVVTAMPIVGPTTVCRGHTITLSNVNVLGTWVWNTSNANASVAHSGVLTGVAGGSDVISYVFTNGCNSVTTTVNITVDTVLLHGVISGPTQLCTGSWVNLTETVTGGIWFSSSSSIAVVDAFGNVTGLSQGVTTISYYLSNGCGASVATYNDTVYSPASMITGGDSVGIGNSITLSDSVTGGTWDISDTTIAMISSTGVVTGRDTGIVIVSYSVTNICGTTTSTLTVNVGPPPSAGTVSGGASVCIGHTLPLVSTVSGGTWSISNGDTLVHATISGGGVVTGVVPGLDTVYYKVTNGFGSTTDTVLITIATTPVIRLTGPGFLALGGDYFIKGMPAHGTWHNTNGSVGAIIAYIDSPSTGAASTSISYVTVGHGIDTIHYHITNACGSADSIFIVNLADNSNGINILSSNSPVLKLFPNPTEGAFTLGIETNATEEVPVVITNMVGEKVKEFTMTTNKFVNVKLDAPSGVYFISATGSDGKCTSKITISK